MIKQKRVTFLTLGCRLNSAESGTIQRGFVERGYKITQMDRSVDLIFINTCTVTNSADSSCRNLIRKAHKTAPDAKIVVAGCYAQLDSAEVSELPGVALVLGTAEKFKIFDYLDGPAAIHINRDREFHIASTHQSQGLTRAFLKVQDGCSSVCSFCIIPKVRGGPKSLSVSSAVEQAKELVNDGFREIVLTGVNIGEYERFAGESLDFLVSSLLSVDGLQRFRLSSIEPQTMTDSLLEICQNSDKFMDYFHLSLQSGDDDILGAMRREYSVEQFRATVAKIKTAFPHAGIGVDVIVGFPGETQQQFGNSYALLEELPITHFHIFPFSAKDGTPAAKMDLQVDGRVKKERAHRLKLLGERKLREFSQDMLGKSFDILVEKRNRSGKFEGYTSNFLKVELDSEKNLKNQIINVTMNKYDNSRNILV